MRNATGWLLATIMLPVALRAEQPAAPVPVLLETPPCTHAKLGSAEVEIGRKVSAITDDSRVPVVKVSAALDKLAAKASAGGANAVVLRSHQGVYFTHNGRRSSGPVYIRLVGALVRLPEDTAPCRLVHVDADEIERRMRSRRPQEASYSDAYAR